MNKKNPINSLDPIVHNDLNTVKKDLWYGGATGLLRGLCFVLVPIAIISKYPTLATKIGVKFSNFQDPKQRRNVFTAAILMGGAFFSYIGSTVDGTNSFNFFKMNHGSANLFFGENTTYSSKLYENIKDIRKEEDSSFERRQEAIKQAKIAKESH